MKKSIRIQLLLLAIILISIGISAIFMKMKQGYHEDEILTYHLSNSRRRVKS